MRNVYIVEGDTLFVEDQLGHSLRRYELEESWSWARETVVKAFIVGEVCSSYQATNHGELIGMIIEAEELEADPRT